MFVNSNSEIVHQVVQHEIVLDPSGEQKDMRPRKWAEPNVETEIPLSWTGKLIKKEAAIKKFVFTSKLQIVHVNGLTYDFLYGMAKELAEAESFMLLGGGKAGNQPLIFRRGSIPYRGFLEGRVDGDRYILLLHLSNMELKRPEEKEVVEEDAKSDKVDIEKIKPAKAKPKASGGAKKEIKKTLEKAPKAKSAKAKEDEPKKPATKRKSSRKPKAETQKNA